MIRQNPTGQPQHLLKSQGFNVYHADRTSDLVRTYSRKDFYKICLFTGESMIDYADKGICIQGSTLFFGTPHIPYSWEDLNKEEAYTCLFTEEFLKVNHNSESLQRSPLFKIGGTPVFPLTEAQAGFATDLFKRMIEEYNTDYIYKDDLIRNYNNLLIHEALKLQPAVNFSLKNNASRRVASLFLELLERQFPIESPERPLQLKSANDYAERLAITVNHLNRSIRDITGKSTTNHISERIVTEAKALLRHTNWSIADVAYGLGFEYPTYFNNFFKRFTDTTPTAFRGLPA